MDRLLFYHSQTPNFIVSVALSLKHSLSTTLSVSINKVPRCRSNWAAALTSVQVTRARYEKKRETHFKRNNHTLDMLIMLVLVNLRCLECSYNYLWWSVVIYLFFSGWNHFPSIWPRQLAFTFHTSGWESERLSAANEELEREEKLHPLALYHFWLRLLVPARGGIGRKVWRFAFNSRCSW